MSEPRRVTAAALIIGNEILSGRTHDVNLKHLGIELNKLGIQVREARVVADIEEEIVAAVNQCRAKYDYVFTTGGIGPTHDDITADCIAKAFGQKLILHPEAERILRERVKAMGGEVTEARLRMARTPEHAELLYNEVSGLPGFKVDNVFVMAGIPRVMQAMFQAAIPFLEGGVTLLSRTIGSYVPEGTIATALGLLQDDYPDPGPHRRGRLAPARSHRRFWRRTGRRRRRGAGEQGRLRLRLILRQAQDEEGMTNASH
jgi:molybdenum cofactor synthesis domain-containing protein